MPLPKQQRDELEDTALKAFTRSFGTLLNCFRIQTAAGQVAAVDWNDMAPGNEVEVALVPARLTDKYDLTTTQARIAAVKAKHLSPCNVHKHGSDWPIFGLQYGEARSSPDVALDGRTPTPWPAEGSGCRSPGSRGRGGASGRRPLAGERARTRGVLTTLHAWRAPGVLSPGMEGKGTRWLRLARRWQARGAPRIHAPTGR